MFHFADMLRMFLSVLDLEVRLHGVVQRAHEGGVVDRGGLAREGALGALIAVRQDVLLLLLGPRVKLRCHVEAAPVVRLLGHVLHKVALEVDQVGSLLYPT